MYRRTPIGLACLLLATLTALSAADLTLMQKGQSPYQIVLPDEAPSPRIKEALQQTARLMQTAFAANGCEIKVVEESKREAAKPALFLGNTQFARQHDFVAASLRDWSYVHRAVGEDIIIAGNDAPAAVAASARHIRSSLRDSGQRPAGPTHGPNGHQRSPA